MHMTFPLSSSNLNIIGQDTIGGLVTKYIFDTPPEQTASLEIHPLSLQDFFINGKEYYDIFVSNENVLTTTSAENKEWTDYIGGKPSVGERKILLQVPNALLETLTLSTTNEDISLLALSVNGSVSISANGGNIMFGNLEVE